MTVTVHGQDILVRPVRRLLRPAQVDHLVGTVVPQRDANLPPVPMLLTDHDTDQPVLAYLPLPDVGVLRKAVLTTPMTTTFRGGSGLSNVSRTFGMGPRKPTQWREGCAPTSLARDHPAVMAVLTTYAQVLKDALAVLVPHEVAAGAQAVAQVLPEWRLADDALWTSGVINRTSALPYHRDGFNFDAWSAMPVLRRGVRGGHLHLPEYDLVIGCKDGWAVCFNGFRLVHGVTPITPVTPDGYRYSVVYYALRGMKDCHTAAVESAHAKRTRTDREQVGPDGKVRQVPR